MEIELCFTPTLNNREQFKDRTAVVIDVLRASTSICTAIRNNCRAVIPVSSLDDAMSLREKLGTDQVLLCGERLGFKVEGFDLGNSPSEYSEKVVKDHTLIFASTNGSGAIVNSRSAGIVLVAGFVNLQEVSNKILDYSRDLVIVCAGREGRFALEDSLCGGMLIQMLLDREKCKLSNDAAKVAHLLYKQYGDSLEQAVREADHGRYLESLGYSNDISLATALDTIEVIPVWSEGKLISFDRLN